MYGKLQPGPRVVPYSEVMGAFHRNRTARVMTNDYGYFDHAAWEAGGDRVKTFVGAHGVSILSIA